MAEILATIADHVREVVARRRRERPLSALRDRALFAAPARGFGERLAGNQRRIVAEVKKASPSKGLIRAEFDPAAIDKDYAAHGASAISVLTEERFFQGDLVHLEQIRAAVSVPLLRKDFMLDPYQIVEAKSYGADAVLFIAAMLEPSATRFDRISYLQVLEQGLKVMDATAISLCMDNRLPIVVFNLRTPGNIRRAIAGEPIGSLVTA